MAKIKDLTGKRFTRYKVLSFAYIKNKQTMWLCRCDCGIERIVRGSHLKNGSIRSCGCYSRENAVARQKEQKIRMIGRRFNRLLVLEDIESSKDWRSMYRCLCVCNNKVVVAGAALRSGRTQSCGCLQREKASEANYNPDLTDKDRKDRREYPEYKEWRKAIYERDDYTCQRCNVRAISLNAHHLESYVDNPELRTTLENGITLCKDCHKDFHHQYGYGKNTKEQFESFKES